MLMTESDAQEIFNTVSYCYCLHLCPNYSGSAHFSISNYRWDLYEFFKSVEGKYNILNANLDLKYLIFNLLQMYMRLSNG